MTRQVPLEATFLTSTFDTIPSLMNAVASTVDTTVPAAFLRSIVLSVELYVAPVTATDVVE